MSLDLRVADEFRGVEAATKLSDVFLEPIEGLRLRLSFSLMGGLREAFNPEVWDLAYSRNDMMLIVRYSVEVLREGPLGSRRIVGPLRMQREGRLYQSRDPWRDERIWVMVVDEDERAFKPNTADEVKQLLFDFEREVELPAGSLARGRNRVWARVRASWPRHVYVEKGEREGRSRSTIVEVV